MAEALGFGVGAAPGLEGSGTGLGVAETMGPADGVPALGVRLLDGLGLVPLQAASNSAAHGTSAHPMIRRVR